MDRLTCDIIRDLLPLYIDEVCSAGSRALVEGHLQNCPACKAEYETISKREFFYDARERKVLDRLSKRWKQSRRKMLFVGATAALLAALLIGLIAFGCSMKVIPAEEIAVSSLSRLGNGDLAFILQSADGKTGLRELSYYEMDGKLYLTATTTRFPLFSASESAQSGWIVHTRDTGIQQIVYQGQGAQLPVWDANAQVELADSQTERRIEGMEKLEDLGSDALLKDIFQKRVTYIGAAPKDMELLGALRIETVLGSFSIRLTTSSEPYGIILDFKKPVAPADCKAFDAKMRAYAVLILALIDNGGTVGWTYQSTAPDGKETELTRVFTLADAKAFVGGDVKRFAANEASLRELCDRLGLF